MLPSVNGAFPSPIYLFLSPAKSGKQKNVFVYSITQTPTIISDRSLLI